MADNDALYDLFALPLHRTYLADHFFDGGGCHLEIILAAGERGGQTVVGVLHIRQINVHKACERTDGLGLLITTAVVYHRHR